MWHSVAAFCRYAERFRAPFFLIAFVAVLIIQLFVPPAVGVADNGDSARLTGDFRLTPNYLPQDRYFLHFTPDYLRPDMRAVWTPGMLTTGRLMAHAAAWIGRVKPPGHFDVRWMGFVYLCLYASGFALLLATLNGAPGAVRWIVPALAILIFGDVFYAAYLNSFYLDATGLVCFVVAVVGMHAMLNCGAPPWSIELFAVAAIALAGSKPLDAPCALLMGVGVALWSAIRLTARKRIAGAAAGAAVACSGLLMMAAAPAGYQLPALLEVVMIRVVKTPQGLQSLSSFGLLPSDMRYAGQDAFRRDGPGTDAGLVNRFSPHASRHLLEWYATHPGRTLVFLREDLEHAATVLRPFGDLEKQYSTALRSDHFSVWSDRRAQLLRTWPALIPLVYLFALAAALLSWVYRPWRLYRDFGALIALIVLAGTLQFCGASLLDATETSRHLFMFHATTDVLILAISGGALWIAAESVRKRRGALHAEW